MEDQKLRIYRTEMYTIHILFVLFTVVPLVGTQSSMWTYATNLYFLFCRAASRAILLFFYGTVEQYFKHSPP